MTQKLHVSTPVLVEGKYDKNILSQLLDATILTTDGFGIFNSEQKQAFVRRICGERGILLLTDPDGGGRQIRSFLLGILPRERVHQLYIPKIPGKERRKRHRSRSGLLGVEGMDAALLRELFLPFADEEAPSAPLLPITVAQLYADGLSGTDGAAERRARLCERLALPADLSAKAFVEAVGLLVGREVYERELQAMCDGASVGE